MSNLHFEVVGLRVGGRATDAKLKRLAAIVVDVGLGRTLQAPPYGNAQTLYEELRRELDDQTERTESDYYPEFAGRLEVNEYGLTRLCRELAKLKLDWRCEVVFPAGDRMLYGGREGSTRRLACRSDYALGQYVRLDDVRKALQSGNDSRRTWAERYSVLTLHVTRLLENCFVPDPGPLHR